MHLSQLEGNTIDVGLYQPPAQSFSSIACVVEQDGQYTTLRELEGMGRYGRKGLTGKQKELVKTKNLHATRTALALMMHFELNIPFWSSPIDQGCSDSSSTLQ